MAKYGEVAIRVNLLRTRTRLLAVTDTIHGTYCTLSCITILTERSKYEVGYVLLPADRYICAATHVRANRIQSLRIKLRGISKKEAVSDIPPSGLSPSSPAFPVLQFFSWLGLNVCAAQHV